MTPQSLTTRTLDEAIAAAVARVGERARTHGGAMARLGEALIEATTGGKRVRPALVVRSCAACGGDPEASETLQVAASFELLHTAFLLHDDVIDHDTLRRGVPNVSARLAAWASEQGADAASAADLGAAAAILGGDLLLAEAQRLILRTPVDDERLDALAELFSQSLAVTVAGELADVAHAALGQRAGASAILTATHDKTAVYSFAAPLTAGAVLAGATATQRTTMRACGSDLGLAFQLVDDLIGAFGSQQQAGKEPGADLREAKQTALVALARESAQWPGVRDALAQAHTGPIAVRAAQEALGASGARGDLEKLARTTLTRATARASEGDLPDAAIALVDEIAALVEARIP